MTNVTIDFTPTAEHARIIGQAIATTLWDKVMAQLRREVSLLKRRARGSTGMGTDTPLRDWLFAPSAAAPATTVAPPTPIADIVATSHAHSPTVLRVSAISPEAQAFVKREAPRFGKMFEDIGIERSRNQWGCHLYLAPNYDPDVVKAYLQSGGKASS